MSERTDSQIIHEARGLFWHKVVHRTNCDCIGECIYKCAKCSCDEYHYPSNIENHCRRYNTINYTDPTSYLEAMAWAKEQKWWKEFVTNGMRITVNAIVKDLEIEDALEQMQRVALETTVCTVNILLDPKQGSHALASYLEGREG